MVNLFYFSRMPAGMNQLTRSLAAEWASDKIRVNCVAPGLIMTDMAKEVYLYSNEDITSILWPCLPQKTKTFQNSLSHRIFRHMHEELNIDRNKN